MRLTICLTAAAVLCASSAAADAKPRFQLNKTTWTFVDKGTRVRNSIDASGNYIENSIAGKHIDHGKAMMKGSKACFTSAMTNEGEMCWTTRPVAIGHSMVTRNDKGRKITVKRVAYVALKM